MKSNNASAEISFTVDDNDAEEQGCLMHVIYSDIYSSLSKLLVLCDLVVKKDIL